MGGFGGFWGVFFPVPACVRVHARESYPTGGPVLARNVFFVSAAKGCRNPPKPPNTPQTPPNRRDIRGTSALFSPATLGSNALGAPRRVSCALAAALRAAPHKALTGKGNRHDGGSQGQIRRAARIRVEER